MFKAMVIPSNGRDAICLTAQRHAERALKQAIGFAHITYNLGRQVEVVVIRCSDNTAVRDVMVDKGENAR